MKTRQADIAPALAEALKVILDRVETDRPLGKGRALKGFIRLALRRPLDPAAVWRVIEEETGFNKEHAQIFLDMLEYNEAFGETIDAFRRFAELGEEGE
jgi:hypothetical protein